jgi:prepilin-type N-terminal cleavage/methylation domain-containing protein/prepilin-type processing-associated H-X9-DG protein
MKLGSRKAFTLIELLVVIAIIAILAAILFPVFAQAREKARQITCASNMKQLALACIMYQQDFDELFPAAYDGDANIWSGGPGANTSHWQQKILPYVKSNGIYGCPDDPGAGSISPGGWAGVECSYGVNGWFNWDWTDNWGCQLIGVMTSGEWNNNACASLHPGCAQPDSKITHPDGTIMLCELWNSDMQKYWGVGNLTNFGESNVVGLPSWLNVGATIPYYPGPGTSYPENGTTSIAAWNNTTVGGPGAVSVHHVSNTLSNYAFVDGHVKALTPTETNPDCTWSTPGSADSKDLWNAIRP